MNLSSLHPGGVILSPQKVRRSPTETVFYGGGKGVVRLAREMRDNGQAGITPK